MTEVRFSKFANLLVAEPLFVAWHKNETFAGHVRGRHWPYRVASLLLAETDGRSAESDTSWPEFFHQFCFKRNFIFFMYYA